MLLKSLCIATSVLTLMGCQHSMPLLPEPTEIPANLAAPCPNLPQIRNGESGTVLRWGAQIVEQYAQCQNRHKRLVEAWPKPSQP